MEVYIGIKLYADDAEYIILTAKQDKKEAAGLLYENYREQIAHAVHTHHDVSLSCKENILSEEEFIRNVGRCSGINIYITDTDDGINENDYCVNYNLHRLFLPDEYRKNKDKETA